VWVMNLMEKLDALPADCFRSRRICFQRIRTEEDLFRMGLLSLPPEQQAAVNPLWFSLGRAYIAPEQNVPFLILQRVDERPAVIGFIQLHKRLGTEREALSWSFFIIPAFQGMGLGAEAAKLAISLLRSAMPEVPIHLSVERDNSTAQRLYAKLGFCLSRERDGDDLVYVLP
jgi:RimJ/RimL family protein N-acetyltransferase